MPRGYAKDHPRAELLRQKGLTAWQQWPPAPWLGTRKAKDRLVKFFSETEPFQNWLAANVGPSTAEGSEPQALTPGRLRARGSSPAPATAAPMILPEQRRNPAPAAPPGYGRGVRRTARRLG